MELRHQKLDRSNGKNGKTTYIVMSFNRDKRIRGGSNKLKVSCRQDGGRKRYYS